jgi:hypothetical protein
MISDGHRMLGNGAAFFKSGLFMFLLGQLFMGVVWMVIITMI